MLQTQKPPIPEPFVWQGVLTIDGMPFRGTGLYYARPLFLTWFELFSDRTALAVGAHGVELDDLIQVLDALRERKSKSVD